MDFTADVHRLDLRALGLVGGSGYSDLQLEIQAQGLLAPDSLRRVEVDYRGRRRVVLEYGWPGQRIWGATAAILFNLRERLERSA